MSSEGGGGGEWGVIPNDNSISDWQIMDKFNKIEAKAKEKEKELVKEKLQENPNYAIEAFQGSHFICPRSHTIIPKYVAGLNSNDGAIEEHKADCPFCQERIQKQRADMQAKVEGNQKMGYILGMIERAKAELEGKYKQIDEEKRLQKQNWEKVIEHIEKVEIPPLQYQLKKESEIELPKLLNHENEITRNTAREVYEQYLKCSDREKRQQYGWGK